MKIAIAQPVHETGTDQLTAVMQNHPASDAVLFPEGYLANEDCIEMARDLAKTHSKMLITGYRNAEYPFRYPTVLMKMAKLYLFQKATFERRW